MRSKPWIAGFAVLTIMALVIAASCVVVVDPCFHYHKPKANVFFYNLYNQRSQNDGIIRNFDYDGIITGTSMAENFKASEAENLFGCKFIKVPFFGATYNEINDNLVTALNNNPDTKVIIRGLDMDKFIEDKDARRYDLGEYPDYMYNKNPFDDVEYVFNRDVIFGTIGPMITAREGPDFQPGITSFDKYCNWMSLYTFGINTVFPNGTEITNTSVEQSELTTAEIDMLMDNIHQNVTELAERYPDVTFYYFFTPYSAAWWQALLNEGNFEKQLLAERLVIEEILKSDNIKLYSFNNLTEITTDLNNYRDKTHYGEWINSLILMYMKDEICVLTCDNYCDYLSHERDFYGSFDYRECFDNQVDYSDDYYVEDVLLQKCGIE